jgi:hypothetical protein
VQRAFEEIAEAKAMRLNADQMARVRDNGD